MARLLAIGFALSGTGCRIQREVVLTRADAGSASPSLAAREQRALGERPRGLDTQSKEALSLWVLNRPAAELAPRSEAPAAASTPDLKSELLIALDSRSGEACARAIAKGALEQLEQGQDAHSVAVQALTDAARFRWARSWREIRFHVAARGAEGRSAGVLSTALSSLPGLLADAWRRGGVIDARERRAVPSEPDAGGRTLPADCSESPAAPEAGTVAVLLASSGHFDAALIQRQADSDAGLLGYAAQPSTALAVGPMGAVAVIGGCSVLPEAASASALYAALVSGQHPGPGDDPACRLGYVWLSATGGDVTSPEPSAWALASTRAPRSTAGAEEGTAEATDAGGSRGGSP